MANPLAVVLHASGAESASGSATAVDIGELRACVKLRLTQSAISGTAAKLTVHVETGPTLTGPWKGLASFPALSAVGTMDRVFADCMQFVRARWALEGETPSSTFSVSGAAHVLYAKAADIGGMAIAKSALQGVKPEDLALHCLAGTDEADGYLGAGKTLPLTAWLDDLTSKVADLVLFKVMKQRGFQPEGADELIVKGRDDAISWLKGVARGDIEPPGMIDSTPEGYEPGLSVVSDTPQNSGGSYW